MTEERKISNPVTGEVWTSMVRGSETGGASVKGKGMLPPGTRPPGIHRHPHQDERVTVLSGRVCVQVGKETKEYGPGESAFLPRGVWHDFWVVGDEPAETIGEAEPALGIELILGTLAGLAQEGKTDKKGRPRPLQGAVIGTFFSEVAEFRVPPPIVQRVLLPPLAAIGRRRGLLPYYDRHFEPGEIDAILDHWAANRPWAGNRRPSLTLAGFGRDGVPGWPAEAIGFFEGLEADNSKTYWQANKDVYDRCVRGPLDALLEELASEFGPGRAFRPYRDVRFSQDKSPYKTSAAALVGAAGYVAISAEGLNAGAGMVHLAPDQLDRYRRAVDDSVTGVLEDAVTAIRNGGNECGPHEALKSAPKGYGKDHARIELLRAKGIIMWHQWPPAPWLGTAKAKDRVAEVLRASAPLTTWLAANVGESILEPARR